MYKTEIKHYIYTALATSRKFKKLGFCKTFDDEMLFGAFIVGKTYDCFQVEGKPDRIEVSGFFHIRAQYDRDFSDQPGFFTMEFKSSICQEFLKFTEVFKTLRPIKYDKPNRLHAAKRP